MLLFQLFRNEIIENSDNLVVKQGLSVVVLAWDVGFMSIVKMARWDIMRVDIGVWCAARQSVASILLRVVRSLERQP